MVRLSLAIAYIDIELILFIINNQFLE